MCGFPLKERKKTQSSDNYRDLNPSVWWSRRAHENDLDMLKKKMMLVSLCQMENKTHGSS